jgi:hypothetical protein
MACAGILCYELARCKQRGRPYHQWIPFIAALILDLSVEITGFAIHAFAVTPLARLMHATSVYVWLLDLLIYLFKRGASFSALSSLSTTPETEDAPVSATDRWLSLKQLRLLVSSPFRVDTPRMASSTDQSTSTSHSKTARASLRVTAHHSSLSVGPVIRRASRIPSWLNLKQSHKRNGSSESGEGILEVDIEQQAGPDLVQYYACSDTGASPNPAGPEMRETKETSTFGHTLFSGRTSVQKHSKGAPSVASTNGTYDENGIRLDSPTDIALGFGQPKPVVVTATARSRQNIVLASTLSAMQEEDESPPTGRINSLSRRTSATPAHSSTYSTPTGAPSLLSRQSNLSLSYFPRPPSTSAQSRAADRGSRQMRRKASVTRPAGHLDFSEFDPPKMPATLSHQHVDSWQSRDTFTGSDVNPADAVVTRGFDVTS